MFLERHWKRDRKEGRRRRVPKYKRIKRETFASDGERQVQILYIGAPLDLKETPVQVPIQGGQVVDCVATRQQAPNM